MADVWRPLAVALVSSGSRGNKLLFYHTGISTSRSLEYELLNKLPQRTLSEILASCSVMQDRKFELKVDDWKFVGHPFVLQANSVSFNIAFVLQSQCSPEVVKSYDCLSQALGVALIHEEKRMEFFKNQFSLLMQITDQVETISQLSETALNSSSLAKTLHEVLCGLQKGDPHVHVFVNNWSEVSLLVHSQTTPTNTVKSYSALILLTSLEEIASQLPSYINPSFHRFLYTISPLKSLIQVSLDADIPLQQAIKFACHLIHWGQAITVYPLSETNIYINSLMADTRSDSILAKQFKKDFYTPSETKSEGEGEEERGEGDREEQESQSLSLPEVLFYFSAPITLAEMRDLYPDEKLIPIVTWLLKHKQIVQLHTYIYLVPPQEMDDSSDLSPSPLFTEDILYTLSQHLSQEEIKWVGLTDAARDSEDMASFTKLSCYLHGNHHLEEILMLENMSRSELLSLIDKFSEILTTASLPEN